MIPTSADTSPTGAPRRKVLVIDDSPLIREAAKIALNRIGGWEINTAASGEQGIKLAASERFDAILTDVMMPGMDGIAVAEHLHCNEATSSVPIILLTAQQRPEENERFFHAGIVGVIAKPFEIAVLSRNVAYLLGWPA